MISTQTNLEKIMQERKSVRKYKENVEIPKEKLRYLIEQATSAPSSSNMQPWRFLIITDQKEKEALLPIAFNQEQIATSSAVIAVLGDLNMFEKAEEIYNANAALGFMPQQVADNMAANSRKLYGNMPKEKLKEVIQFDAGLITMQIMLLARDMGYDTVPMGGFDRQKFAEHMGLSDNEYAVLLLPIGEAAQEAYGTSRLAVDDILRFK
ncbi:nitroreductase family protein [Kurthia senegalensis]|uniref:nitroreductase family protein n=1 Tax=Kurthia senegalensis TaxID=1033740 RepID=UPI000287D389|nr:nitroreductase family protein [Kurthia senegalensis]